MALPLDTVLLVLCAALLHAGWNALIKAGEDRLLTMTLVIGVGAVAAAPALFFVVPPAPESWIFLLLSAAIHVGYFFFLLEAYRVGDLSHVYPVSRGAAPLLVAAGAALFAGETLGLAQLSGLVLASLAIASFAVGDRGSLLGDPRPFLFGLGVAVFISGYTVTDGLGVRASGSPEGFIAWLFVIDGLPLVLFAVAARRGRVLPYIRAHWRPGLIGGLMCALAYGLVIWALDSGAMAFVSALRETSVVFAVLIGWLLLGERLGVQRIIAALLAVAGIALMNLAG